MCNPCTNHESNMYSPPEEHMDSTWLIQGLAYVRSRVRVNFPAPVLFQYTGSVTGNVTIASSW
jgi:hypothetical protein